MTWAVISIILISIVKILMTCLPTGPVEWLIKKFEVHSKLTETNCTVTMDGKPLEDEDKFQVIHDFNEATFLEHHYIYPGTEDLYLHPESSKTPLVIETKKDKNDVRLFVFSYNDRIDVVKQYKKKVFAYSLLSDRLQKSSLKMDTGA
ncbi:YfmQ family protein [Bacillus sp. sid0103]|uniref:YfmQ family protein n=1 Tax=Bacillus sp. sid0103 TaxID=2856337 RepID=UPI001C473EFB|nr:YfmQ family protein [Bacillus sp. sid0103]MBV7506755.1 YfmQ family protein [Bacillus sp. sid0103]